MEIATKAVADQVVTQVRPAEAVLLMTALEVDPPAALAQAPAAAKGLTAVTTAYAPVEPEVAAVAEAVAVKVILGLKALLLVVVAEVEASTTPTLLVTGLAEL